jgi:DNA-binding Lrp family transcriptional regulator
MDGKKEGTMVDRLDKEIIRLIQGDLPLSLTPFSVMAEKIGVSEETFIARVQAMKDRGIIRRFGATLRHQEAGFNSNAMVIWFVPEEKIDEVGRIIAGFREVTHCYQRRTQKDWKYNLFSMVHGNTRDECFRIARLISRKTGISDYRLLFSEKEFKKTSMAYY